MKRIYHPFNLWEEYHAGMWRSVKPDDEIKYLKEAIEFTGDHELYGCWMLKVLDSWPKSCEHNLSDTTINRQAWIGHAACCLAIKCPEYITRRAWHVLSTEQQDQANKKADIAIELWEERQNETLSKSRCSCSSTIQSVLGV